MMQNYWKCHSFSVFYKALKNSLKDLGWSANGRSSTSTYWTWPPLTAEEVELLITQPVKDSDMEPINHVGFAIDARCSLWESSAALNAVLADSPFAGGASPILLRGAKLITSSPTYLQSIFCVPADCSEIDLCASIMRVLGDEIMPTWRNIFTSSRPNYRHLKAAGVSDYTYILEAIGYYLAHNRQMNDDDAVLMGKLLNQQQNSQVNQSYMKNLSTKAEIQLVDQIRWLATRLPR
jgi:hypothetical protein